MLIPPFYFILTAIFCLPMELSVGKDINLSNYALIQSTLIKAQYSKTTSPPVFSIRYIVLGMVWGIKTNKY